MIIGEGFAYRIDNNSVIDENLNGVEFDGDDICKIYDKKYRFLDHMFSGIEREIPIWEREQEIDWTKVTVDTKLLVYEGNGGKWVKRHFAKYEKNKVYCYNHGLTSFTCDYHDTEISPWSRAKLYKGEC
jgi:hypothetical protein